jgi:predicted ATPase
VKIIDLEIKGYRSLRNISWGPNDLNIVIGPNGSGKSNLLRMLELISISARGQLGKHVQRAGGMDAIVWDGAAEEIQFTVKATPADGDKTPNKRPLTYKLTIGRLGKGGGYSINYELLGDFYKVDTGQTGQPFKLLERDRSRSVVFDEDQHSFASLTENVQDEESLLSIAAGPFGQNRQIPPFQTYLAGWSVYHDLPVNMDAPIRQPTVARHETHVESDGQNLISVLHTLYTSDRDFKDDINQAMQAAFGDDFEELVFPPAADQRIQLRVRWKSLKREQSAADLSDGTLRFLFLLTVLASPNPGPLVAIDEPETGLHPSMLPIIAEYAADAAKRTQLILTTHSPQLLDAFSKISQRTTVVKWADGETSLEVVDEERLNSWLEEFSLESLFRSGELEDSLADSDA